MCYRARLFVRGWMNRPRFQIQLSALPEQLAEWFSKLLERIKQLFIVQ
jgi:hypothetical protein